jgi:hypothetical protein
MILAVKYMTCKNYYCAWWWRFIVIKWNDRNSWQESLLHASCTINLNWNDCGMKIVWLQIFQHLRAMNSSLIIPTQHLVYFMHWGNEFVCICKIIYNNFALLFKRMQLLKFISMNKWANEENMQSHNFRRQRTKSLLYTIVVIIVIGIIIIIIEIVVVEIEMIFCFFLKRETIESVVAVAGVATDN